MDQTQDNWLQEQENKMPSMLNVLTILTFIGCLFPLWDIFDYATIDSKMAQVTTELAKAQEKMDQTQNMPDFVKNMTTNAMTFFKQIAANKIGLIVGAVLSLGLCLFGAIQMRARKKSGFFLYLIGEIIPFIIGAILIGGVYFSFINMGKMFMMGMAVLFIILYATQLKHLNK